MNSQDRAGALRADGRRNREQLMDAARTTFATAGTDASLREIARRAGVGIATLYRHFPTREALLEALLGDGLDRIAARAENLTEASDPDAALYVWTGELVAAMNRYAGLPASMLSSLQDPASPLHAPCTRLRTAAAALLARAQRRGRTRPDLRVDELLSTANAVAWLARFPADPPFSAQRYLALFTEGWQPANDR